MGNESVSNYEADKLIPLIRLDELKPGELAGVNAGGIDLVLINVGGQIRAFEGHCPHMGTLLSEGELVRGEEGQDQLVCRAHKWRFDCATGKKHEESKTCLASASVQIRDGQVMADITDLTRLHNASGSSGDNSSGDNSSGDNSSVNNRGDSNIRVNNKATDVAQNKMLPGPRAWPLVGSLLSVNRRAFHLTLEAWAEQYGRLYTCRLTKLPLIVVSDEAIANAVLKARPDAFRRTSQLELVSISGMNTHGIFMAEGDRWRKQRPVIMQSLDTRHLKQFFPLLMTVTERLRRRWSAGDGEVVDVQSDLMRFTVDVTTSLAFGQDINTLESDGDVIQEHLDKIFPIIQRRLLTPIPYWRYFRLPSDRAAEKSVEIIHQTIKGFVEQGRKELDGHPELRENPQNLLQSLLVAVSDESLAEEGLAEKDGFTEKEVTDNVMTMLLAGEDTTANSIAWVIYFLVKYPDIQDRLRSEIESVLGNEPLSAFEQVRAIPYLDGVIHESMRFKPVAPINILEANCDFEAGELNLKKGDYVVILTRSMAMRESDFADAGSFKPDRWMANRAANQGGQEGRSEVNQRAFIPFGSGPRLCPGRSLALLEMKMVLVMIMQSFIIRPCVDLDKVEEELSFTMNPKGLKVSFGILDK